MADQRKPAGPEVYEFFAPFAHVPGRYEWARIRSPTHGVFDAFIVLDPEGTHRPAVVYVEGGTGESFMADRYPECTTVRVARGHLRIAEEDEGRTVIGFLEAEDGPVRRSHMRLAAPKEAVPRQVPYGGDGKPTWGSQRFTCWGVDLVVDGRANGQVGFEGGRVVELDGEPAVVTLGSFGRITALESAVARPS